ncbi:MAG: TerB family tellurite resistance protein [Bacteroidota bacterium]|nr:TerB family tellurite resistance protein [Bacteroidota bacterium]
MNGFFEYQYLSYKKKHMMNLIALARTDGDFHEKEMEILFKIGKRYRLKAKHINALLEVVENDQEVVHGQHEQYMEQLYDLVEMVLADGVIAEEELEFCEKMIHSMGYNKDLLGYFIDFVQLGLKDSESWIDFKEEAMNHKKTSCPVNA